MNFQLIYRLPQLLHDLGVSDAVISPGSRSAPLAIAFACTKSISKYIIPDERSAGYIAMGLALATGKPVAVICTSGTAVANLYPAVIEAYYQKVPIIVITADRPPEWIDHGDGQTIRQVNIFSNHIKQSYAFPVPGDLISETDFNSKVISSISLCLQDPAGPVHLNIPFREPLYPPEKTLNNLNRIADITPPEISVPSEFDEDLNRISEFDRVLIIGGQGKPNTLLNQVIQRISANFKIPVISEIISNLHPKGNLIVSHDLFLSYEYDKLESLQPDLILTIGDAVLSKNLKVFLRKGEARHWHVSKDGFARDVFKNNCKNINANPEEFFQGLLKKPAKKSSVQESYYNTWQQAEKRTQSILRSFFPMDQLCEMEACKIILDSIPDGSNVHLSNSMPVRWANYCQCFDRDFVYYSNRGTSGIDGCLSTAVGISLSEVRLNFLIIGDMAFFYDRNALWHNHIPQNLRIIILNNHGGGIFHMIEGPSDQPEFEKYFTTDQKLMAKNTAKDYNLEYFSCNNPKSLYEILSSFIIDDGKAKILEIETDSAVNKRIFNNLKSKIEKIWN